MIPLPLPKIAELLGGVLQPDHADGVATGASTDTRRIRSGDLFFALDGANYKGSDFLPEAIRGGAVAAVTHHPRECGGPLVVVEDAGRALMILARSLRQELDIPVVAITGSNGKTTTKDALGCVLKSRFNTVVAEGSYNNRVGLPLTLARSSRDTEVLVLEVGTSAPGEIAALADIARPTLGVITSIGLSHLEGLGSAEGVLAEKLTLTQGMRSEDILFLNGDDPWLGPAAQELRKRSGAPRVVTFGLGEDVDRRAHNPCWGADGVSFCLTPGGPRLSAALVGRHNLQNLLAVALCAEALGMSEEAMAGSFPGITPAPMRLEERRVGGQRFVLDCYNANPTSMNAALEVMADMENERRRVAVLGDMLELGQEADRFHRELGRRCIESGLDLFLFVGPMMRAAFEEVSQSDVPCGWAADLEEAREWLDSHLKESDFVLVKGSRGMALEHLVEEASS